MTAIPKSPLQMVMLSSKGVPPAQLGSKLVQQGAPVLMPGQSSAQVMVNKQPPNLEMVTLVAKGGTPVILANQYGAPFPTTGSGALVFADGATLTDATFTGNFSIDSVLTHAGNALVPSIAFQNDPDTGIYSSGDGSWSVSSNGVQMFDVTPTGIVVHGNVTYTGQQIGAYHDPLTNQGDIYYRGALGSTRLPLGLAGTVLVSDGNNAIWSAPPSGIVIGSTTIGAGTNGYVLFDNAGHAGEYPISGTGSVAMTNAPVFTGDVTPSGDRTVALGSDSHRWSIIHTDIASVGGGGLYVGVGAVTWIALNSAANGDIVSKADGRIGFSPSVNDATAAPDVAFSRVSAGVGEFNNGTLGTKAEVQFLTKAPGDNTVAGATTAFVRTAIANAISGSGFAPINNPTFTGDPQAPTPATADNDNSIATTAFVKAQSYITAAALAPYALLASPTFTGDPQAPTPATSDNDTSIATTAFVKAQNYITAAALAPYALLASPAFTGNPTAPTPAPGDNDTSLATTAFVSAAITAGAFLTGITAGTGTTITGASPSPTVNLANTTVAPGTYGDATHVPQITVDAQGRITVASNIASGGGGTPVTPSIYDRLTTAQPADPGGYTTFGAPMSITQGSQVPWPSGAVKTFTALNAAHPIEVDLTLIHGAGAAQNFATAALFIDGAANSVQQASVSLFAQAIAGTRVLWRGVLSAGAHTFQARWAGSTASYLLRNDSAILTGSNAACTISIREVAD